MPQESTDKPVCSIYDYIKMNTKDGSLPEGFRIPWLKDMWAPGAKDGMALNHMIPIEWAQDPERDRKILEALKLMASEDNGERINEVLAIFEELDLKDSIVRLFGPIVRIIVAHQNEIDLQTLLQFGDYLICNGVSLLAVKVGLSVISAFKASFVEEVMTELGVYDEFTYYAARTLSNGFWLNGNEELFALARNTKGWGRINAVEWLEPTTQEIRDWLLYEGANNTILPQYSADICLQKAEAEKRLDSALSVEEYEAIGKLIREALEEDGPCAGVTDGERVLPKYISKAKEFKADPEAVQMILDSADKYSLGQDVIAAAKQFAGE